jgi:hypothetical protein
VAKPEPMRNAIKAPVTFETFKKSIGVAAVLRIEILLQNIVHDATTFGDLEGA